MRIGVCPETTMGQEVLMSLVFEGFATMIRPKLVAFALRNGARGAEDIAQETLKVLWEKYSHLAATHWVLLAFTICRNKIHQARRRIKPDLGVLTNDLELVDMRTDPFQLVKTNEMRDRMIEATRKLSGRCKAVVQLV